MRIIEDNLSPTPEGRTRRGKKEEDWRLFQPELAPDQRDIPLRPLRVLA